MADRIVVNAPYDLAAIREYPLDDWELVDKKLQSAADLAADRRQALPIPERIAILEKCADLVEARSEEFALEAAREGGKPLVDSRVELARAVNGIREAARSINQLIGEQVPMKLNTASQNRIAYTMREPIGVVVAISAFNHPFNLIVHQVIPAVAVGAPVVVKPAGTTPISCFNLLSSLYEAGLPKEWAQIALCSSTVAERMATDSRVAFLSFIGSGRVGWMLRSKLHPGARCALEHGGSAPVIVQPDADIEDMLPLLAKGGLYHAGQVCVSVQRVFVHRDILETVQNGLVRLAERAIVGDPTDEKTEIGPLISEKEVNRVDEWVKEAIDGGAKLLTGGKKISGTCYAPTILLDPPMDAKVSKEEIFGPVICLYTYTNLDEAIRHANDVPFSFQAAVFTKHIDRAFEIVNRLEALVVMINDHTAFRVDWMPFGGRKQSGMGIGGIQPTMKEMTEEKMFVLRSPVL